MRDVAVVSFAYSAVAKDALHNEVEMIVPVVREAVAESGIPREDLGFVCSGSLDYLQGGPFAFVMGLDGVGAWPPKRESHVEMDAAWALYEAWVAIQTGEVDSALVYGFGKSSTGDLHEIMTLQTDPYYVAPLWPSMVDMAALQATAYLDAAGLDETNLAEVAVRSQRNGQSNPHAVRAAGDATVDSVLAGPVTHQSPTVRRRSCWPQVTSPGRCLRDRRGSAASSTASKRTVSVCATSPVPSRPRSRHARRGSTSSRSTSSSCTPSSATRS